MKYGSPNLQFKMRMQDDMKMKETRIMRCNFLTAQEENAEMKCQGPATRERQEAEDKAAVERGVGLEDD